MGLELEEAAEEEKAEEKAEKRAIQVLLIVSHEFAGPVTALVHANFASKRSRAQ